MREEKAGPWAWRRKVRRVGQVWERPTGASAASKQMNCAGAREQELRAQSKSGLRLSHLRQARQPQMLSMLLTRFGFEPFTLWTPSTGRTAYWHPSSQNWMFFPSEGQLKSTSLVLYHTHLLIINNNGCNTSHYFLALGQWKIKKPKPNNKQTNKTTEESDSTGVIGDSGLLRCYTEMFSTIAGKPHTEE